MSRRKRIITIALVVIIGLMIGGSIFAYIATREDDQPKQANNATQVVSEKACGLVPLDKVKQILGSEIQQQDSSPTKSTSPVEGADKKKNLPSTCLYIHPSNKDQQATMITVLPVDKDDVKVQIADITSSETFKEAPEYGDVAYKETRESHYGTYQRVVVGYDNAVVAITVDNAQGDKLKALVSLMQEKVRNE